MARSEDGRPLRVAALLVCAVALATTLATAVSAAGTAAFAGTWRHVPPAPSGFEAGVTAVFTGTDVIVAGLAPRSGQAGFTNALENAAAYNPVANTWRRLPHAPATPTYCRRDAVWTRTQMLVWSCRATAFDPAASRWRRLPNPPTGHGFAVWTGLELIGWGGGCCGDAGADGSAYNPATNTWHRLPRSPLAPEQSPAGVWTGREVLVFVSGISAASGKPLPARFARAAAYDPAANSWRAIAPRPVAGGAVVWDGSEAIVVAAGTTGRVTEAYDPGTNRWRRLAPLPARRVGAHAVWTGRNLILWGGHADPQRESIPASGFAYDPRSNRWQQLAPAPMRKRDGSQTVWAAERFVVVGGEIGTPAGTSRKPQYPRDGAAFTPRR